jgi:hypothetical protein
VNDTSSISEFCVGILAAESHVAAFFQIGGPLDLAHDAAHLGA